VALPNPLDSQSIVTGLDSFSSYTPSKQIGIDVVAVNNPKIARVRHDVQPATALIEHAAHSLSPIAAIT
jgi:hypothetical protein